MTSINLIFAGSGEFGVPTLNRLASDPAYRIVQVITQIDRPAGRGRHLAPTAVAQAATALALPLLKTTDINSESLPPADLLLIIAFGQKISEHLAKAPRLGSINLHASLLPRHRGAAPVAHAILSGDTETGNSVIRLAQSMDAGAIISQSRLCIADLETAGELHDRLALDGPALVTSAIAALSTNSATEHAQDAALATRAPKLTHDSACLEFTKPADQIARQIRAMHPWPGCRVSITDPQNPAQSPTRVTLVRAKPTEGSPIAPGLIDPTGHIAAAAGSAVEIIELQPQGGRPMPLAAYCNGHPWHPGLLIQSIHP
jgi:methionyl-tRNA formyltransferase